MLDSKNLLFPSDFPAIARGSLATLQVNLGYRCNQSCVHCHVDAGPKRTEVMSKDTLEAVLAFLGRGGIGLLDLTGGAPELNPGFRRLVQKARELKIGVMDRCNLTVLEEPGQEDLAGFLAEQQVAVVASLPCYLKENVNGQRGKGVFEASIRSLRRLNALGYGEEGTGLRLDLVYNPLGPSLPPSQESLEQDYKRVLQERYGIQFSSLLTLINMPIARFGSMLQSQGRFHEYLGLLKSAYREGNLEGVMCRTLVSVDWQGYLYDCDFNQMLDLPLAGGRLHISELASVGLGGRPICVGEHCWGCTAGQGSSCSGALS